MLTTILVLQVLSTAWLGYRQARLAVSLSNNQALILSVLVKEYPESAEAANRDPRPFR